MKNITTQKEKNTNIHDRFYYEKILISVDKSKIAKSGFSELEKYGVYADNNYTYFYKHIKFSSQGEIR